MAMNILTEGKRFSACWRRSSDVPLVGEHFPSLTACIPAPAYLLSPTGALSKKVFHRETGEVVRRALPQRQLATCRVNDDQPTLRDDAAPEVSVCIADVSSSTQIFRHLPPTRLSSAIFLHPSVSTITPGYRVWNKNHKRVTVPFKNPQKRKPLQKQLAACREKEDHPTLCDDAVAAVFVWPYGRASRDCQGFCRFLSRCMGVRACDNHVPRVLVTC